ncbi:hypothetical protein [Bradyrhizobium commune]|uniref:Uncharacterized protein n=1 Tax=Bradyrhizobium commune TaxID=83627 RepID=A0A7S9DAK5_9BRAD|nr:hypothetical protein [Bradyrhizobium commune]QPF93454.1 hypothetical protein IC761_09380 [Bradyrhizobium commune]
MSRLMCLFIAVIVSLLPVFAPAAAVDKKPKQSWHGYGFLPGYRQPLSNSQPLYMQKNGLRRYARDNRRNWYIDPVPYYYGWNGDWHYFGRPGFGGPRYNGGSFGPCWTRTPIGAIWNCG